jgi:copper(I)-binding protein
MRKRFSMYSRALPRTTRLLVMVAVASLSVVGLAACGADEATTTSNETTSEMSDDAAVVVSDAWVKAVDSDMTAAFGTLTNNTDEDVTLVAATTDASAMVELHEVVMKDGEMVMQPKEGGIPIPAGGSATLEPGGDHIMLMDVTRPIEPGDVVELDLELSDGSTITMTATAKEFSGADEDYQSDSDNGSMGDG